MRVYLVRVIFFIIIGSTLCFAQEGEFRIDKVFGGKWCDAEKSINNKNDDWLCWATASANVLMWSGWGDNLGFNNEDEIFDYLSKHWEDKPNGSPRNVWLWWFSGEEPTEGAKVTETGGGFYKNLPFTTKKWETKSGAIFLGLGHFYLQKNPLAIKNKLDEGYGIAIQIVRDKADGKRDSHVITLWGYKFDDENNFKEIIISDSDDDKSVNNSIDAKNELKYIPVKLGTTNLWVLEYNKKEWQIFAAYALRKKSLGKLELGK